MPRCRVATALVARTSARKPANTLPVGKCSSGSDLTAANHNSSEQQLLLLLNSMLATTGSEKPAAQGGVALALFARTLTRPASGPPLRTHPAYYSTTEGCGRQDKHQANLGVPRIITNSTWTPRRFVVCCGQASPLMPSRPRQHPSPRAGSPSLTGFPPAQRLNGAS